MNIDLHERTHVAAADAQRLDLYAPIHKALRAYMSDTLLALGRADATDAQTVDAAIQQLDALLVFCEQHIVHEDTFMHPAIEARAPGHSATVAEDHTQHRVHIDELRQLARAVEASRGPRRSGLLLALYRQFALFMADNLVHMHREETAHNAALWAHYSDPELAAVHDALVSSIPPDEMMTVLRWMVPNLPQSERIALLRELQTQAPAPAFEAALQTVQPHLSTPNWHGLTRALGLPTVPGLVC